jgi:mannose-1-phosphate guanylyltransferase
MAGGVGSRFWPYSRKNAPKQFQDVLGVGSSLLQLTADRFTNICPKENLFIVTNQIYLDLVKEQLPFLDDEQILLEPEGRNTAPCIAYASYKIHNLNPDAKIIVAPSDHVILKEVEFERKINDALTVAADENALVTLGIKPSRPDTGYGYIQFEKEGALSHKVKRFAEKPSLDLAKVFVSNGDYMWNAGIFIWKASEIRTAMQTFLPALDKFFVECPYGGSAERTFIETKFKECEDISIDYGVMEKAKNVRVVLSDIGWSDLGTWKSLYDVKEKDENENVIDGNVIASSTHNCIIKTPTNKLVVTHKVSDLIIAENDDALLICDIKDEQKVKQLLAQVKKEKDKRYE